MGMPVLADVEEARHGVGETRNRVVDDDRRTMVWLKLGMQGKTGARCVWSWLDQFDQFDVACIAGYVQY